MLLNRIANRVARHPRARTVAVAAGAGALLCGTLWLVTQGGEPANPEWMGGYRPHSITGCALALGLAIGGLTFVGTVPLAGYVAFSAGVLMVMAACGA